MEDISTITKLREQIKDQNSNPFFLTIDEFSGDSVITCPANQTVRYGMTNNASGIISLTKLAATATADNYLVSLLDNRKSLELCNQPIHSRCLFGINGRPLSLPFPIYLDLNQTLFLTINDLSGAPNIIRFSFQEEKVYNKDFPHTIIEKNYTYFYTTDKSMNLPAGTTEIIGYIKFKGDADFILKRIFSYSTGIYKFKVTDTGTGKAWQNGWIHSSMLGNAQYFKDFKAQIIERQSKLRIQFINLSGAPNSVYFTLVGINTK